VQLDRKIDVYFLSFFLIYVLSSNLLCVLIHLTYYSILFLFSY
jgi:hypothetical protein